MQLSDIEVKCAFMVKEPFKRLLIVLVGSLGALNGSELLGWVMALEEVAGDIRATCNFGSRPLIQTSLPTHDPDRSSR